MESAIQRKSNKQEEKLKKPNMKTYPWEGFNYSSGFMGKGKLMILGESFYWSNYKEYEEEGYTYDEYNSDLKYATIWTVEKYLNRINSDSEKPPRWNRTYDYLTKICLNREIINQNDKDKLWDSVVFYNYLNEPLRKSRQKVDNTLWEKSANDFFEVLKFYKPDFILMLGDRLWNHTPRENWELDKIDKNLGCYTIESKNIFSSSIYHTSSRYPYGTKEFDSVTIFNKLIDTKSLTP